VFLLLKYFEAFNAIFRQIGLASSPLRESLGLSDTGYFAGQMPFTLTSQHHHFLHDSSLMLAAKKISEATGHTLMQ